METNNLGKQIAALRKQKGWTQQDLAKKLMVSNKTISKWECGRSLPDIMYVPQLAKYLEITTDELLSKNIIQDDKNKENLKSLNNILQKNKIKLWQWFLYVGFSFAPFIISIISLPFLPKIVPAHYNAAGVIDRWGGSYEMLILGGILTIVALIGAPVIIFSKNTGKEKRLNLWTFIIMALVFTAMQVVFTVMAYTSSVQIYGKPIYDLTKLMMALASIVIMLTGLVLPNINQNQLVGIRISTTLNSKENWRKTHDISAILFSICGIVSAIISVLSTIRCAVITLVCITTISALIAIIISKNIEKKQKLET